MAPLALHYDGHQVRHVVILGMVWFVAADVCRVLGLRNVAQAISGLDEDEKQTTSVYIFSNDISRRPLLINESGLYALVLSSRKPEARAFRKWVTAEVLPAIRRDGFYSLDRPVSRSRVHLGYREFAIRTYDEFKAEDRKLTEPLLGEAAAQLILGEHPDWLPAIVREWAHKCGYHPWEREEAKDLKREDPEFPVLRMGYTTIRDGLEQTRPRATLTRDEKGWLIRTHYKMREGFRKTVDRLLRHDRALVGEHNTLHPDEEFAAIELTETAPDL